MKNMKDDAIWYCRAMTDKELGYIQYFPSVKDPKHGKQDYCVDEWFKTEEACKKACAKLNKATKIGKAGMKANGKKHYEKMTVGKLIAELQKLENQDQEVVIYPKYTGASDDARCDKYRFIIAKMADQWHQNYPYIALMF